MARTNTHPKYSQFRFDAGSLALNFVATVRHRGSQKPRDLLQGPESLAGWFSKAGCHSPAGSPSHHEFECALLLREAIYRTLLSCILNELPVAADIKLINTAAAFNLAMPQIESKTCTIQWRCEEPVKACLAEIARDAVILIGAADRNRLKTCSNRGCQMVFIDNSPANRRRWCAMSICGNRDKIRAHRLRKKNPETAWC